jgi:hypothetical protein
MSEKTQAASWLTWFLPLLYAAVAVGLSRLSRWFYWLTFPVVLFCAFNTVVVCLIVMQNSAVYGERGFGYMAQNIYGGCLPFVALLGYAFYDFRFRHKPVA